MAYQLDIIVVTGLAINLITGVAYAAKQNPWAMYNGQQKGGAGSVKSFGSGTHNPPSQPVAPRQFDYEYAPLEAERNPTNPSNRLPGAQYRRQPYAPGYGYQPYGRGNIGGQFGFGMNFNPGFSQGFGGTGLPFGFGVPSVPFFGGSNYNSNPYGAVPYQTLPGVGYGYPYGSPYGNPAGVVPYGGIAPWGMGFPMF